MSNANDLDHVGRPLTDTVTIPRAEYEAVMAAQQENERLTTAFNKLGVDWGVIQADLFQAKARIRELKAENERLTRDIAVKARLLTKQAERIAELEPERDNNEASE